VGGVSEGAGAKAGGVKSSALISFACRDGRRHPGFLDGSALRGALSERRPWSARFRLVRLPPHQLHAPVTAGVRRSPRRGTTSAYASKRRRRTQARDTVACGSGRVLRSVLRPVLVNPHYTAFGLNRALVGHNRRHRGWANLRKRDEPAPGSSGWTECGSPRITARKSGVMRTKRKMVEAIVPARKRGPRFGCPHVSSAVAEVVRRRLTSNKLGKRAPKRAAGSSERGSSSK